MVPKEAIDQVHKIVVAIGPLLHGQDPLITSAALADLVAMLIAGHRIIGKPAATKNLQKTLLQLHVETVRKLIPVNMKQQDEAVAHGEVEVRKLT
jgi:hypothetical protein